MNLAGIHNDRPKSSFQGRVDLRLGTRADFSKRDRPMKSLLSKCSVALVEDWFYILFFQYSWTADQAANPITIQTKTLMNNPTM
jgi:hypothetical protein